MNHKQQLTLDIVLTIASKQTAFSNGDITPVPKREIAEALKISRDYVDCLLAPIINKDIVASRRGVSGGVFIERMDVSVLDIINHIPYSNKTGGAHCGSVSMELVNTAIGMWDEMYADITIRDLLLESE